MGPADSAKRYQVDAIQTAPPGRLVLMLFDGALRFMASAAAAFEEKDLAQRLAKIHANLIKAQNVLRELQRALDMERGSDFAQTMFALYDYMIAQLNEANLHNDVQPIQIAEKLLGEIRASWAQMLSPAKEIAA